MWLRRPQKIIFSRCAPDLAATFKLMRCKHVNFYLPLRCENKNLFEHKIEKYVERLSLLRDTLKRGKKYSMQQIEGHLFPIQFF